MTTVDRSAAKLNLVVVREDTLTLNFTITDDNGVVVDISGWNLAAHISDGTVFAITVTDGPQGEFTASLTTTQTEAMPSGLLTWDLERRISGDPDDVRTLLAGTLQVRDDVTRI